VLLLASAAVLLAPAEARAASCCGGGGGAGVVVPKGSRAVFDLSTEGEWYAGYFDSDGLHKPDPPGSALAQYRVNLAAGWRLAPSWQVGGSLGYVWNDNQFTGYSRSTNAVGDATLSVWWEAWSERSIWKVLSPADLLPSVTLGTTLTVPTGLSMYDDVVDSYDITGRGFYRLDGNLNLDKAYRAFSASVNLAYGAHFERPVNRLYGEYKTPYHKKLGNRGSASGSVGYKHFISATGDALALTGAIAYMHEDDTEVDGVAQANTRLDKTTLSATLTWSSTDRPWTARLSWSHALRSDGWGMNFPSTDIVSLGFRYVVD
jgi:hypothetical protein